MSYVLGTTITAVLTGILVLVLFCEVRNVLPVEPGKPAPYLIQEGDRFVWRHLDSFAAIPEHKVAVGLAVCKSIGYPTGYHPHARDLDGDPFPNGGFLCGAPLSTKKELVFRVYQ